MPRFNRIPMLALAAGPLCAMPALAEPVDVVTDIAPLAALVAAVQDGRGSVVATVDGATDPHHVTLRPSQARHLAEAELAIWIGPELSPWFGTVLQRLAGDTTEFRLLESAPVRMKRRDDHGQDDHAHDDHGHDDHAHDDHGHDDHAHDDHGHDDHAHDDHGHDDHAHDDHAHDDHGHTHLGDTDPHAWLAPENAVAWLGQIATALATIDPAHAEAYHTNAAATADVIESLAAEIGERQAAGDGFTYVAAHDSFQYAEPLVGSRFAGTVSDSHAVRPGPAHLAGVENRLRRGDIDCLLSAPADADRLLDRLSADFGLPVVIAGILDAEIEPEGFTRWFARVHEQIAACAGED